ncbi:MAG TPA: purine-nucleoside phosphorylase [Gemmatimonadales bacterium]|nr:purine-nucleoside phosphorylase [Gemmatimonadales bacterium]
MTERLEEREARRADQAAEVVRRWLGPHAPRAAIVLGSGLGDIAGRVDAPRRLAFSAVPEFPEARVPGHDGELVAGTLGRVPVIIQAGRAHLYEGHTPATVALPVRVYHRLGVQVLVVTNAAATVRPNLVPGSLMLITDHINFMWRNPLIGRVLPGEERFPDMSAPYDEGLGNLARGVARDAAIPLAAGVYAGLLGPSYETPAEIRMLAGLGADAVGMSTVPEVITARALGMRVLGLSMITNLAAGLSAAPIAHAEVLETGRRATASLAALVTGVLDRL